MHQTVRKIGAYATARWTISDDSWVAIKVVAGTYSKVFLNWNCPDTSWTDSIALAKDSCKNRISLRHYLCRGSNKHIFAV